MTMSFSLFRVLLTPSLHSTLVPLLNVIGYRDPAEPVGDPTEPVGDPTGPVGDPTGPVGDPT